MKIVSAARFVLVAQSALLVPFEVAADQTDPCKDRTDSFRYHHTKPDRAWCIWLNNRYADNETARLNQCRARKLISHCPETCKKPECLATDAPTTASPTTASPTTAAPTTLAPVPAPGPPGNNNDLEILKAQMVQMQADILKILTAVDNLSEFVMRPDEPSAAPSDVPSVEESSKPTVFESVTPSVFASSAPSTECQVEFPDYLGDGYCDGGDYNTEECDFDGGDCVTFNTDYPNCDVPEPEVVGDGFCDDQHNQDTPIYNIADCDFDGGDCAQS